MFLTLHDALVMANMAYGDNFKDQTSQDTIGEHNWRLQYRSDTEDFATGIEGNSKLGYSGLCFTQHIPGKGIVVVVSHRGTAKDQFHNFVSDSQIVSETMPTETKVASHFSKHCQGQIKATHGDETALLVIHVGHSLGGAHARIVSCQEDTLSLTADNPGMLEILNKMGIAPSGMNLYKHLTLLSESNPVNEQGARCGGELYQLVPDLTRASAAPSNLDTHALAFLIARVPADHESAPFMPGFRAPDGFRRCNRRYLSASRHADAKMLPFVTQITLEEYARGDETGYRMKSELAYTKSGDTEWVSDQRCLVHLICTGQGAGHSMIVVERVKQNPKTGEYHPEIGYYDLVTHQSKVKIQTEEYPFHAYYGKYDSKRTASFEFKNSNGKNRIALVDAMIASIKADQENSDHLTYKAASGGVLFPGGPHIVNCCSWSIQKLAIAKIVPNHTRVIVAIPRKMKPHGVKAKGENNSPRASAVRSPVRAERPEQQEEARSGHGWCTIS